MNVHQTNLMRGMMLIGGELVQSESGQWLDSVNPANEEMLGQVPQGTAADVNRAVAAAEAAHPAWAALEPKDRAKLLKKLAHKLRANTITNRKEKHQERERLERLTDREAELTDEQYDALCAASG